MWTVVPGQKSANSSSMMAESDIHESASVAHLYGKKYVAAESLTANGLDGGAYSYFPGNLKATADLEMANGVNRFVIHESTLVETNEGGKLDFADPTTRKDPSIGAYRANAACAQFSRHIAQLIYGCERPYGY